MHKWVADSEPEFLSGGNIDAIFAVSVSVGVEGLTRLGLLIPMLDAVISGVIENPRRCVSPLDRAVLLRRLLTVVNKPHTFTSSEIVDYLLLERSIYYRAMEYASKNAKRLTCSKSDLFVGKRLIESSYKTSSAFRERLIHSYSKLAAKQAHYDCTTSGLDLSVEDVFISYLLAVGKAIDKYNSTKGALASFVANWITAHRNDVSHEYGISYVVPKGYKGKESSGNNLATEYDCTSYDLSIDPSFPDSSAVAEVVMRVDPSGVLALLYSVDLSPLGFEPKGVNVVHEKKNFVE